MAVTAKFQADFNDFVRGVNQAESSLADLSKRADSVGSSLQKSTAGVNDLAGATASANVPLEFFGGLFTELAAPAGILAAVTSLGVFTKELIDLGGRLQDLTDKTGIGVESLQTLSLNAEQSGTSIDAVATATFELGKRLAIGHDSTRAAVDSLGLSFADLRNKSPEDALLTVARALDQLPDRFQEDALGAQLFGRSVRELIPFFHQMEDASQPLVTISAEQAHWLDVLGDGWVKLKSAMLPALAATIDAFTDGENVRLVLSALNDEIGRLPKVTGPAKAGADAVARSMADFTPKVKTLTDAMLEDKEAGKDLTAGFREQEKQFAATLKQVDQLEGTIRHFRQASLEDLAQIGTRVKQDFFDAILKGVDQIQKAQDELGDFIAKETLSSTDYQILQIHRWQDEQLAAFKGTRDQYQSFSNAIVAIATERVETIKKKEQEVAQAAVQAEIDAINALNAIIPNIGHGPTSPNGEGPPPIVIPPINVGSVFHNRATGGPVNAGQPFIVGEAGPEVFIPKSSGTILPNGTAAGAVQVTVNVTQPFGTPDAIGRAVSDALTQRMRNLGLRLPT